MTNEELVQQIQDGNKELLPELWEGVRRFVRQQAYRWACAWVSSDNRNGVNDLTEDLYQEGYLATEEASRRYKPDEGVPFISFLVFYLKKHFRREIAAYKGWTVGTFEKAQKAIKIESLNRPILNEGSDDAVEFGDKIADPTDFVEESTERMFLDSLHTRLDSMLKRLEPDERGMIQLRYYKNMGYAGIASLCGCTTDAVATNIKKGIGKLRDMAAQGELDDYIDKHTNYYTRVSVAAFQNTGVSSVELVCLKREEMLRKITEKINRKRGSKL